MASGTAGGAAAGAAARMRFDIERTGAYKQPTVTTRGISRGLGSKSSRGRAASAAGLKDAKTRSEILLNQARSAEIASKVKSAGVKERLDVRKAESEIRKRESDIKLNDIKADIETMTRNNMVANLEHTRRAEAAVAQGDVAKAQQEVTEANSKELKYKQDLMSAFSFAYDKSGRRGLVDLVNHHLGPDEPKAVGARDVIADEELARAEGVEPGTKLTIVFDKEGNPVSFLGDEPFIVPTDQFKTLWEKPAPKARSTRPSQLDAFALKAAESKTKFPNYDPNEVTAAVRTAREAAAAGLEPPVQGHRPADQTLYQRNKQTGQVRVSTDGGKTWTVQ